MIMKKHKCDENVYGRKCNESFDTESQYKKHFSNSHKVTKENPLKTKSILKDGVGMVTIGFDSLGNKQKVVKETDYCVFCGKKAYVIEAKRPICYGHWSTWGCFYTKRMIDEDRQFPKNPCRHRNTYVSKILTKKEREKLAKYVSSLEKEVWARLSWTPLEELMTWHDDKLLVEQRVLEQLRLLEC